MHTNSASFLRAAFLKLKRNGIFRWRIACMVCLAMIGNTAIAQSACQVRIFSPDEENAIAAIVRDINGISSINHEIAAKSRATLVRLVLTRWELLGTAAPDISDGTLVTNLLDLAANTSGETASALERSCSQVNELIAAETIPVPALNMVSHEVGSAGTIAGLNGAKNSKLYFKVNVPHGITDLVIQTNGTEGDADLYVSQGARPTKNAAQCYSMGFGLNEQCRFDTPDGGAYYILLNGYADYSDLTLKVSWRGRGTPLAEILTGHLYDSAVQGIQYRSCNSLNAVDCIEGITGLRGEFNYTAGQQIEFKLGGLRIGVAQGQELVTPDKLANGDAGVALQIAQLLQSLDEDRDPSNGIVIPESVRSLAVGAYPNGQDVRFVNNSQVLSNLAPGRALVSLEQTSVHAKGASLMQAMLASDSDDVPKSILGTYLYPTTGSINYELLNRSVHARLRLALFYRKLKVLDGLLRDGASVFQEIDRDNKAWVNKIEAYKAGGDLLIAYMYMGDDQAKRLEALTAGVAHLHTFAKATDENYDLNDGFIEMGKAAALATSIYAGPKEQARVFLESIKASQSFSDNQVGKRVLEWAAIYLECVPDISDVSQLGNRFETFYSCTSSLGELAAKGLVEAYNSGRLLVQLDRVKAYSAARDYLEAYYKSGGNPEYMRSAYNIDPFAKDYDAQKLNIESRNIPAYVRAVTTLMAEIEREANVYANAFNLKYAGLLELKAAGIKNGGVVPVGTAVDFEATFKNMSAGSFTVRSINWVATGVGTPSVVATGTRANVSFNSAGTYRVAAHAEVLLPDGKTYFMVDTFTVAVQDAIPVPTLTLTATPGDGYVDLSWNAIPGATSYMVHMTAGVVGPDGLPSIGTTSATSYRVNGLQNGALHRFTVRAFRNAEVMVGSGLASATPQGPAVPPVGELIAGRYLPIEGGAVIRDTVNGLEWQRCSVGQTWNGATQRCDGTPTWFEWAMAEQLVTANGFRLPTLNELKTLVYCSTGDPVLFGPIASNREWCSDDASQPTIVEGAFPDTPRFVWSGTRVTDGRLGLAWSVDFLYGDADEQGSGYKYAVRLVRGVSSFATFFARKESARAIAPSMDTPLLANLTGYDGTSPNAATHGVRPDATGRGAYFLSRATNLVPGINNGAHHLFHFDASTGQIKNLGASTSGAPGDGDITAFDVALQAGKLVFRTKATNLESGPGLYLVDLHTGQREPLVTSGRGEKHDPEAERPAINAQGTWVAWDQPGAEGAWRVLGLEVADRSGQPPTLLNETTRVACCVRFDAEGRYLVWREAATDGRVVVSVLDYATGRHATVEWPAGVAPAPDTLRVEFAQGGRTLQWVRIGDVLQGEGAEAGNLLHQVNNPLFTPPERLQ